MFDDSEDELMTTKLIDRIQVSDKLKKTLSFKTTIGHYLNESDEELSDEYEDEYDSIEGTVKEILDNVLNEVINKFAKMNLNDNVDEETDKCEEYLIIDTPINSNIGHKKFNNKILFLSDSESEKDNNSEEKKNMFQRERQLLTNPYPRSSTNSKSMYQRFAEMSDSDEESKSTAEIPLIELSSSFEDFTHHSLSNDSYDSNSDSNEDKSCIVVNGDSFSNVLNDTNESFVSVQSVESPILRPLEDYYSSGDSDYSKIDKTQPKVVAIKKNPILRRDINEIIHDQELGVSTRLARVNEEQRVQRLTKRLKISGLNDRELTADVDIDSEDSKNLIQHKNDEFNCRNSEGRVLVNLGHEEDEPDIYLAPKIQKKVMPHQIGGIRFLFDNLIESVKNFDTSEGFGCILSHSMGLGKTLQVIALVDIFLKHTTAKTVLIVMPVNVLNNWVQEIDNWLPQRKRDFEVLSIDKLKGKARDKLIISWHRSGGVLLIGYEKYQRITSNCEAKVEKPKDCAPIEVRDAKRVLSALVDPGPDMIICDEGHRIKNDETGISKALKKVNTKRRVILTGYPLQNKLKEYYCMIDFVRPHYLGLKWEFNNTFERPITNGQCKDSTDFDKNLMKERSHVLNHLLKGFIQRRMEDVLKAVLPQKHEFVVLCKLTEKQVELTKHFLNTTLVYDSGIASEKSGISLFRTFTVCSKICNHPDIIHKIIKKGSDNDNEINPDESDCFTYAWAKNSFNDYQTEMLAHSSKMVVLFDIIEETVAKGEKLLIFSQWLFTLDLIERLLQSRTVFDSNTKWSKYQTYYRLDGQTKADEREDLIKNFNSKDKQSAHLFLISTKAGGIGINLIGANRIVIFDACWNPCHDAQASCRAYRPGQTKPCFIYRLISENSMEKRIFNKQIFKQGMAKGVVDDQNIDLKLNQNEIRALIVELNKELEQIEDKPLNEDELIHLRDPLLLGVCKKFGSHLTAVPSELETYLIENKNLALTSSQKKEALESFQAAEHTNSSQRPNFQQNIDSLTDTFKNIKF